MWKMRSESYIKQTADGKSIACLKMNSLAIFLVMCHDVFLRCVAIKIAAFYGYECSYDSLDICCMQLVTHKDYYSWSDKLVLLYIGRSSRELADNEKFYSRFKFKFLVLFKSFSAWR